jgi:guanidinoacetate N-methyltransferase
MPGPFYAIAVSNPNYDKSIFDIGFPDNPYDWKSLPATFANGKLSIAGHPVMEDWERPYMKALANVATLNGGTVLEIGFGLGLSASYIQENKIEKHIIIEANTTVFEKVKNFAQNARIATVPVLGFWQEEITSFPDESIDGILFDAYALSEEEFECHFPFFKHAYRILKNNGIFTYYSSEVEKYSSFHLEYLQSAGFKNIAQEICQVSPPEDCLYWNSETIMVPIIRK